MIVILATKLLNALSSLLFLMINSLRKIDGVPWQF
jgi:hypothetical protein